MMKKVSLTIVIMLVMSIFVGMNVIIMNEPVSAATTTYVTSSAAVNTTWPIQDAINDSSSGDTIIVNITDGAVTYYVGDLVVNKSITLKSGNGSAQIGRAHV